MRCSGEVHRWGGKANSRTDPAVQWHTRKHRAFSLRLCRASGIRQQARSSASCLSCRLAIEAMAVVELCVVMNIEALCAAPPGAFAHSPSQMPLSCPVAHPFQREMHEEWPPLGVGSLAHPSSPLPT